MQVEEAQRKAEEAALQQAAAPLTRPAGQKRRQVGLHGQRRRVPEAPAGSAVAGGWALEGYWLSGNE